MRPMKAGPHDSFFAASLSGAISRQNGGSASSGAPAMNVVQRRLGDDAHEDAGRGRAGHVRAIVARARSCRISATERVSPRGIASI